MQTQDFDPQADIYTLIQVVKRIHLRAAYEYLKMYMRTGTPSRISGQSNLLSLRDRIARFYEHLAQMAIARLSAIRMIDINDISVAASPACLCNRAAARCHNGRTDRRCPVDSLMIA